MGTNRGFDAAISHSALATQDIARAIRNVIIAMMPDVVEVPWPRQHNVGYGTGLKKKSEHFCHITTYTGHVNLGFDHGTELPDPQRLLEGTGKRYRHVKVRTLAEVRRPAIRRLIAAAIRDQRRRHH
jgi:hypothetical protein